MFSNFYIYLLLLLFNNIFSKINSFTVQLRSNVENYVLDIYNDKNEEIAMILNTGIEKSLIAAKNCSICKSGKFSPSEKSQFLNENVTQNLSYFIYRGNEYLQTFYFDSTEKIELTLDYINFEDIKYKEETTINGILSLNFINYNIPTERKIFALDYKTDFVYLDIGEINTNIVTDFTKLVNYSVTINNNTNNTNNNNNSLEWYLEAKNLIINNIKMPIEKPKLILDTFSYNFYIPKKFFFDNIDKILPKKSRCQVQMSGSFVCKCDENYKSYFSNFVFEFEDGNKLFINTTDYISYDSSISGSNCFVYIIVNYNNDYFIAGNNVLNNYYSIFDVDNKTLSFYPLNNNNEKLQLFLMFVVISILSVVIFLGSYYLYKKYVYDFHREINNIDNIENEIHHL
jgi:hypothetical protein